MEIKHRRNVAYREPAWREWWDNVADTRNRVEALVLVVGGGIALFLIAGTLLDDSRSRGSFTPSLTSYGGTTRPVEETPPSDSGERALPLVGEPDPNQMSARPVATHKIGPITPLGEPPR